METTDREILIEQVVLEATALKKNATPEERGNLSFATLSPYSPFDCIYGQMTGDCWSIRAEVLIRACAQRAYKPKGSGVDNPELNGSPEGARRNKDYLQPYYFSPIEVFIVSNLRGDENENAKLIAYLKGETETLLLQ